MEGRLDALIGNVVFPDEAQDRRIERCDMSFPIGERAFAFFGLLVCDFRESPVASVNVV